eukprot:scaffold118_cov111-Skeletonema_marinoi.AAC.4
MVECLFWASLHDEKRTQRAELFHVPKTEKVLLFPFYCRAANYRIIRACSVDHRMNKSSTIFMIIAPIHQCTRLMKYLSMICGSSSVSGELLLHIMSIGRMEVNCAMIITLVLLLSTPLDQGRSRSRGQLY